MTSAARSPLPAGTDDPRDALLDAAEEMIRRTIALDLGFALETRILRLFQDLVRRPATPEGSPADAIGRAPIIASDQIDRAIRLVNVRHFVATSRAAGRDVHLATLDAELAALKSSGGAV